LTSNRNQKEEIMNNSKTLSQSWITGIGESVPSETENIKSLREQLDKQSELTSRFASFINKHARYLQLVERSKAYNTALLATVDNNTALSLFEQIKKTEELDDRK